MNPYRILDIDRGFEKQDIIRAAARAMREKKFTVKEIAEAQKTLMNPISRCAYEFLNYIDIKPLQKRLDLSPPESLKKSIKISGLEYHHISKKES